MFVDSDTTDISQLPRPDAVVVGSGPAGIVCALELAKSGLTVTLVESGKTRFSAETQALSDANQIDTRRHAPMAECTRRQIGGASVIWGGRCVPYDPIDFAERPHITNAKWPVSYNDVKPFFTRACEYFFCGEPTFTTHDIAEISQKTIVPGLTDGHVKSSDLERWSLPTNFGKEYAHQLAISKQITVIQGLSCQEIVRSHDLSRVTEVRAISSDGRPITLQANTFIIACGGLESTRLLMASNQQSSRGIGGDSQHLGKYYMGHISGRIARVKFHTNYRKTVYGFLRDRHGVYLRPRFTFTPEIQLKEQIANSCAWLVNPMIGNPSHGNGVLSFAYLALTSPMGKYMASDAIRKSAVSGAPEHCTRQHIWNMIREFPKTASFIPTFGIKRFALRRRVPGFFQRSASNQYPLHYHCEQVPNPQSCVTLSNQVDATGLRRLNIDLQYTQQDVDSVIRAHKLIDEHLRTNQLGQLEYLTEDLEQCVWNQATDGFHQAGTTRMSSRPEDGVVDPNCRVHGVDNLYVASGSVFPTSGQANTTFMIVVFALRLADHLKQSTTQLNPSPQTPHIG